KLTRRRRVKKANRPQQIVEPFVGRVITTDEQHSGGDRCHPWTDLRAATSELLNIKKIGQVPALNAAVVDNTEELGVGPADHDKARRAPQYPENRRLRAPTALLIEMAKRGVKLEDNRATQEAGDEHVVCGFPKHQKWGAVNMNQGRAPPECDDGKATQVPQSNEHRDQRPPQSRIPHRSVAEIMEDVGLSRAANIEGDQGVAGR